MQLSSIAFGQRNPSFKARPFKIGELTAFGIAVVAIIFQIVPGLGEALQWQRKGLIGAGLTGHFVHWSWNHLIWDVTAFLALAYSVLRIIPQRFLPCLLVAGIFIPIEIAINHPRIETYRGLSGIDSALFGLVVAGLWKQNGKARWFAAMALAVFLIKTFYELTSHETIFVSQTGGDFIPVTSAHITGVVSGIVVGLPSLKKRAVSEKNRRKRKDRFY